MSEFFEHTTEHLELNLREATQRANATGLIDRELAILKRCYPTLDIIWVDGKFKVAPPEIL